ncbi:MFS transporter [Klebsiella sp. BIGb0407]|uniref:MFS transporter n=1 Tax=Klebsiella sp. BIGb0407 TaxID=2940603 RepID=UPI00216904C2|nr:MFS transporter [Klebsiella sp. BIGb0407]MCS3431431.1 MFS family permease [Klebsiella sp. BIGb0407]
MQQAEIPLVDKNQAGITITLALSMLLASLGTSIANIALPTLSIVFSAPFAQVQAVVVAYLVALTITVVIAGRLGDRHGLKPMLMTGLIIFGMASLLCSIASNLWLLVGARALQGIGAAFLMTLAMALARQTAGKERIGRAMGLLGTVSALGMAIGPSLGGLLIELAAWRSLFWLQLLLAAVAFIFATVTLPGQQGKSGVAKVTLWSVLDRHLAPSLVLNLLVFAVMMTTLTVGPYYLSLGLELQATQVGMIMAAGPVISILSGIPSGRLVDRWGSHRVLLLGLGLLTAGAFLFAFLPNMLGVSGYVLAIIVLTPGYQLFQAANNTGTLLAIPKEQQGTVSGLLNLSRNTGAILGAAGLGAVFASGVGTAELAEASAVAIANGLQLTFLVAGCMMICAIVMARSSGRV